MRAIFSKVMWIGRATTFCVRLSVVLAVVFGVGATALAAVLGDPLKLGRINTIDRLTTLAGNVSGPLLEEKRFIVEEVERLLSVVDKLEATVEANLEQANGLRQSIL